MSDGSTQNEVWALPAHQFEVSISDIGENMGFQKVSGLEVSVDVIEFRLGNSKSTGMRKMPGRMSNGNVTLTAPRFVNNNKLWDWFAETKMNTHPRRTVTIKQLDEESNPTNVYTLVNAFPVKVTGPGLNAEANEIAIETIELAHEGLTSSLP